MQIFHVAILHFFFLLLAYFVLYSTDGKFFFRRGFPTPPFTYDGWYWRLTACFFILFFLSSICRLLFFFFFFHLMLIPNVVCRLFAIQIKSISNFLRFEVLQIQTHLFHLIRNTPTTVLRLFSVFALKKRRASFAIVNST